MSVQLHVKPGDRVKIVIPAENIEFGCDKMYPQGGTGVVQNYIDKAGRNHGYLSDRGILAYVVLDKPFERKKAVETKEGKPKVIRETVKTMYVPTWLLVREEPAKLDIDLSALIRQVEHYDPDNVPYGVEP